VARDFTVKARIVAEDEASEKIEKVESRFGRLTSFLRSNTVVTFGDVANVIRRGVDFLGGFVTAAAEAEESSARLATALGDIGPATARVNKELLEQAAALQKTTRFSDDQVLATQALLLNLGATADQVPKATEAAVELASAFRIDLNQAALLVGRTLQGVATRDVSRLLPALAQLDEEALKAGEGVDLILSRFSGAAAADLETFSGQLASLGNAFDELREKVGASITQNDEARETFSKLRAIFEDPQFVSAIDAVASELSRFVSELLDPEKGLPSIPQDLQRIFDFFQGLSQLFDFDDATESVAGVSAETDGLFQRLLRFDGLDGLFDWIPSIGEVLGPVITAFTDWVREVTAAGEMMRGLGVETTTTEGATAQLGTTANETAKATNTLGTSASNTALKVAQLTAQMNAATAAANRLRAAQAALGATGPVSVQGASSAPFRADQVG
jgi:hypothetical protein